MTELECARWNLKECQHKLAWTRKWGGYVEPREMAMKAALTWLWEEQERPGCDLPA